jgi:hypothetical protein
MWTQLFETEACENLPPFPDESFTTNYSLAVLSIERELAEKLNFDDVIRDLPRAKPEK